MSETETKSGHSSDPIVNCHTHVFTGDYVPPYLAKTFVPFVWWLFHVGLIIGLLRWWRSEKMRRLGRRREALLRDFGRIKNRLFTLHYVGPFVKTAYILVTWWLAVAAAIIVADDWLAVTHVYAFLESTSFEVFGNTIALDGLLTLLPMRHLGKWGLIAFVVLAFLFIPVFRMLLFFILRRVKTIGALLPDKSTKALLNRYLQLGEYARYKTQSGIFSRLVEQHPPGSEFIVLPMDMAYMGAGTIKRVSHEYSAVRGSIDSRLNDPYLIQMEFLRRLKVNRWTDAKIHLHPFIFIDPRRIEAMAGASKPFFEYERDPGGQVLLKQCLIGDYLFGGDQWQGDRGLYDPSGRSDVRGFAGFKIYPALGYHVFDPRLLPLWLYASQNQIPIMTHCVMGVIFYRGAKLPEWNAHPILKRTDGSRQLALNEISQKEFQRNFTHPLNYYCLLEPELLAMYIGGLPDAFENIRELFGYHRHTDGKEKLDHDLSNLKICLGHYGGSSEWQKFNDEDRDTYSREIFTYPQHGIHFKTVNEERVSWAKLEDIWHDTDWYSIITSLMLQFPNVYADISYTLHQMDIFPLLKRTLDHERGDMSEQLNRDLPVHPLNERVLFGTDFYVIRSNKSDKQLLMETQANLSVRHFNLIARSNPRRYLQTAFNANIGSSSPAQTERA